MGVLFVDLNLNLFFFKDELKRDLEELQQEELNDRLNQADHVPVHQPPTAKKEDGKFAVVTSQSSGYLSGF